MKHAHQACKSLLGKTFVTRTGRHQGGCRTEACVSITSPSAALTAQARTLESSQRKCTIKEQSIRCASAMSWYRSYLQESTLYSTSPTSPTEALLNSCSDSSLASPDGKARVIAAPGRAYNEPTTTDQLLPLIQQHKLQHQQQDLPAAGSQQQHVGSKINVAQGVSAPPFTLAALDAAWEGGAAQCSTAGQSAMMHPPTADSNHRPPTTGHQPAGLPVLVDSTVRGGRGAPKSGHHGLKAGILAAPASTPAATAKVSKDCGPVAAVRTVRATSPDTPEPLVMQALLQQTCAHTAAAAAAPSSTLRPAPATAPTPPDAARLQAGDPTGSVSSAHAAVQHVAGACTATAPGSATQPPAFVATTQDQPHSTGALSAEASASSSTDSSCQAKPSGEVCFDRAQQAIRYTSSEIEQEQQASPPPAAVAGASSSSSNNSTAGAAASEDPLDLNLCWTGPGLRRRSVIGSNQCTTSVNSSSSSSKSRSKSTPPVPCIKKQQVHVPPAADSWEAVLMALKESNSQARAAGAVGRPHEADSNGVAAAAAAAAAAAGGLVSDTAAETASQSKQQTAAPVAELPAVLPGQQLPPAPALGRTASSSFRICANSASTSSGSGSSSALRSCSNSKLDKTTSLSLEPIAPTASGRLPVVSHTSHTAGSSKSRSRSGNVNNSSADIQPVASSGSLWWPSSPRGEGPTTPLLRSNSNASCSSLQMAALGPQPPGAVSRSYAGAVRVHQPPRPLGWWLCGGLAVAAVAGGAMAAVYGVMTYFMKMSMMYSLAWKAATGVAAAEGLALGGWSCKNVRVQQAEADRAAAELARVRKQAAQDLAALRALLQQQEASQRHEVSSLTALNERLTHLTHSLQAENSGLQGALDRAAAERKCLEAAAALECKRAETSALVGITADATGRVMDEVEQLQHSQQQLVAMVQELREDLMGLVARQEADGATAAAAAVSAASVSQHRQQSGVQAAAAVEGEELGIDLSSRGDVSDGCSSSSTAGVAQDAGAGGAVACVLTSTPSCESELQEVSPVMRMGSVRGGVNAALAATVSGTLEL